MARKEYDKVVKLAKALNAAEKWRLRDLLDIWLEPPGPIPSEEELAQEMLRDGILDHVPPHPMDADDYDSYKPIKVKGKPVSETIIEERG